MSKNNRARRKKKVQQRQRKEQRRVVNAATWGDWWDEPADLDLVDEQKDESDEQSIEVTAPDFRRLTVTWQQTQVSDRSPEVDDLQRRAVQLLDQADPAAALLLLRRAVEVEPEGRDLWNNLAEALYHVGQEGEAAEIADMIRERWPNYFFRFSREARAAILADDFDRARRLLDGLKGRECLHITEFRSLVTAELQLAIGIGDRRAAKRWFDVWRNVEFHPLQDEVRPQIERQSILQRLRHCFLPR